MNALPVMLAWLAAILLSLVALVLGAVRHGGRGVARVRVPATQAFRANLLEDPGDELTVHDGEIVVPFRPWEIVTVYSSSSE